MTLYEQLGMTKEEFERKEKEFLQSVKASIMKDRKVLLRYIKQTFQIPTDQQQLRTLSWTHSALTQVDELYLDKCTRIMKQHEIPLRAASSLQDAYHLMHFAHAVFLSVFAPEVKSFQSDPLPHDLWIEAEEDEAFRLENQKTLFSLLTSILPKEPVQSRLTLKDVYKKLIQIEGILNDIRNNS